MDNNLGDKLRVLRLARGWTQTELGWHMRMSSTAINAVEHGRVRAWPNFVKRAAKALGVPVEELTEELVEA